LIFAFKPDLNPTPDPSQTLVEIQDGDRKRDGKRGREREKERREEREREERQEEQQVRNKNATQSL
jgi:hypothetical protein